MAACTTPHHVADQPVPTVWPVRVPGPDDERAAASPLARAFATDPGNVARYPDPAARQTMLEAGMRGMFRTVARFGSGHIVGADGHLSAVSLWHPPGVRTAALDLPMVLRPKLAIVRQRARAIRAVSTVAVWHLAHVGAAPEHPGRGLARQLPDRQLARCDEAARLPSWWTTRREPHSP